MRGFSGLKNLSKDSWWRNGKMRWNTLMKREKEIRGGQENERETERKKEGERFI